MSASISPVARKQYIDINGNPAAGSKLFFYAAGSTTKQNTYTDSAGSVPNSNPIILNSEGKTPYEVWFTDGLSYKEVLAPSTDTDPPSSGVLLGDNLLGSGAAVVSSSQWVSQSVTPTYISAKVFTMAGDQTSEFHVGRRIKATVSAGAVYGFITSSAYTSLTTVNVQPDSGALDSGLSDISLGILTATNNSIPNVPRVFNAINQIINGRFVFAQEGTSFVAPTSAKYDLDGWLWTGTTTAVLTISQDSASLPSGSNYTRKVLFTTADAAVAAGDYITQQTRIEGYNCVDFVNNTFTIGFWVRSSVTGIHCVALYNNTSSYVDEYTINSANTWEYKTITVVGGTPTLASTTNTYGLQLHFTNMCGTTGHTTKGAWNAGSFRATSSQVNDAATINNTFYLADVTMNLGSTVSDRSFDYNIELNKCKRYHQYLDFNCNGYGAAGGAMGFTINFPVEMCNAIPTISLSGGTYSNASGITADKNVSRSTRVYATVTALGAATARDWIVECDSRL